MRGFSPVLSGNGRKSSRSLMSPPDVTFIFAEDVVEWDAYLSRQFEGSGTIIHHEQVEKMTFPVPAALGDSRVVLVILSPALVHFLDSRPSDGFQLTRLLKPARTIAMLCGVSSSGLAGVKDVLIAYDEWRHLEAKDKDINMVRNTIELIQDMLAQSKESERLNKPKFKLVPRKVQEGNGKVYVLLTKAMESSAQFRVTLEASDVREVPVKRRNPYTLVFVIPDELMQAQIIVNVHVWCGEDLLGVSPIKCVSKMGELFSLLTSVMSPYEFLCNTLGMATLHDVDSHLTGAFRNNLPKSGFDLLHKDIRQDKMKKTKEEFPTLLHFAARHGLCQLVQELLNCPSARIAAALKNVRGLTPVQLANHAGHNEVVAAIDEFLKSSCQNRKASIETVIPAPSIIPENENRCSNPADYYDIPAHPVPVLHLPANRTVGGDSPDKEDDYLRMKGSHKENIQPSHLFLDASDKHNSLGNNFKYHSPTEKPKLTLLESQAKLIDIMEAYKKGASLTEVERMHNEWKILYQVSDLEAKSTLDGLRNLYAKAQKAKLSKKHSSSFSELRHFFNNKLRRKESIGSKGNASRKNSKESCTEKCSEPDSVRPVSTLSVLSNTSSSSGSSFDRLSTASAGSDSGHHSDFGDDRNNKMKEKLESRYGANKKLSSSSINTVSPRKNMPCLTLSSKPPAPPPRPVKPVSRYGSLEDCKHSEAIPQYAVSKKMVPPSFEEAFRILDYIQPDKSSTLGGDFRIRNSSVSSADFAFDDPNANYDCPPPPRPSCSSLKSPVKSSLLSPAPDPKTDYDLVPPPLPVTSPPKKQQDSVASEDDQSYDIPLSKGLFQRSDSASSNYDFPRTTLMDNTDTRAACTCQVAPSRNNLSSVKSCCVGNKLSSLKRVNNNLPSVPNSDVIFNIEKERDAKTTNDKRSARNQYYNVCLRPSKDVEVSQRDSIPEEMAPPPPVIENESPEEHYKMVGAPIPISFGKVS